MTKATNLLIYVLLEKGFSIQNLIKMGYNKNTVYLYSKKWNKALEEYKKIIKMI